jgi:hypothetical protein
MATLGRVERMAFRGGTRWWHPRQVGGDWHIRADRAASAEAETVERTRGAVKVGGAEGPKRAVAVLGRSLSWLSSALPFGCGGSPHAIRLPGRIG